MIDLHLVEGGDPLVVRLDEAVGDRLAASGFVDAHRLGGGVWAVAPATKVGVASLGDVTVWVRPKVEISRILFLMGYARDPGWRTGDVDLEAVPDLLPALARAFARQGARALEQGLLQGYIEVDDSLTVLRGRLREQDQLRQHFGLALPLLLRFDDYTVDIPENQLLRGATELLLRLPGVDEATRLRLRGLRLLLGEVSSARRPLPAWRATRLNARYHVALWLAELILAGDAVDQAPGGVRIDGFVVDMAKVYEDFLIAALSRALASFGGVCHPQHRVHLDGDARIEMRPDLVWYRDGVPAAVVDAKYKAEKPSGFPYADQYQMLAYCTALGLPVGHLVYAKGNSDTVVHDVRNTTIQLVNHALDLGQDPARLLGEVDGLAADLATQADDGPSPVQRSAVNLNKLDR